MDMEKLIYGQCQDSDCLEEGRIYMWQVTKGTWLKLCMDCIGKRTQATARAYFARPGARPLLMKTR